MWVHIELDLSSRCDQCHKWFPIMERKGEHPIKVCEGCYWQIVKAGGDPDYRGWAKREEEYG